ncbi:mycothiol synthase [Leucobacter luti]|uniref:Mycothiol synthase n=1 Tax=Leucobacter luti TaxID=340320 RepID=A0A4Q7TYC7_9MICO|nr:mycothiol synthase [Leucobacter luti]MBL3698828.1 mycothiol synthase [Leucobacter luti]RZT66206.1 mycothiol synthase [Leucobacter luti]
MITLHRLDATPEAALVAARSVIAEATEFDGASPVSDQALLAVSQGKRDLALFADAPGAERIVAVGIVGEGEVDLAVRPDDRGRGVGTAALAALLDLATEGSAAPAGAGSTPAPALLAWAHGENPAAEALLRGAGFTPVRSLYRMALDPALLPSDGRDPLATPLPDGLSLHTFDAARDAAEWVRVNAAAFASHPEQGRISQADFALMREEAWFDPDDLILLTGARDEVIGSTWVKTVREGDGTVETELYAVGVDPAHAGRGLGKALLDATLARMAQHDPARVTLYVDGENERAVRMYEAAGFTIDSRSRQWSRATVPDAGARMDA